MSWRRLLARSERTLHLGDSGRSGVIDCHVSLLRTPTLLSGPGSMKMTHLLRTLHDGIMVGIGTIMADNPSLNARLVAGRNPRPIVLDSKLQCPLSIKLFTLDSCVKPILVCAEPADSATIQRRHELEAAGAKVIVSRTVRDAAGHNRIDLHHAFELLQLAGIKSIMVEGGAAVLTACLQASADLHIIDRVIVTIAPTYIGGLRALTSTLSPFPRIQEPAYYVLDKDLIIVGKL